jgi:hypothetical protein
MVTNFKPQGRRLSRTNKLLLLKSVARSTINWSDYEPRVLD